MWQEDRRQILKDYLAGLAEDFAKLDRLARIVASLSPQFSRREELARIWLSVLFRLNYRIVSIRISAGGTGPLRQVSYLTVLVGNLSARAEAAMSRLEIRPLPKTQFSHSCKAAWNFPARYLLSRFRVRDHIDERSERRPFRGPREGFRNAHHMKAWNAAELIGDLGDDCRRRQQAPE